jgi:hypothetical protein
LEPATRRKDRRSPIVSIQGKENGFKKPKFVCRMVDDVSMLDSNLADASGFANSEMTWQDCSLRNTQAPE